MEAGDPRVGALAALLGAGRKVIAWIQGAVAGASPAALMAGAVAAVGLVVAGATIVGMVTEPSAKAPSDPVGRDLAHAPQPPADPAKDWLSRLLDGWPSPGLAKQGELGARNGGRIELGEFTAGTWTDQRGRTGDDIADYVLAPGDTLRLHQTVPVDVIGGEATGRLSAALEGPVITGDAALVAAMAPYVTYTVEGVPYDRLNMELTEAHDGQALDVELTLHLPLESTNAVGGLTVHTGKLRLSVVEDTRSQR
jgi:alternate signal-mediated exported protein